jgi:hypothetical protein
METDNNEENHAATPASSPTIANLTLVGSAGIAEDNFGLLLRRGSQPEIYGLAATGFSLGCLAIRDQTTFDAFANSDAMITASALACTNPYEDSAEETESGTEEGVFEGDPSNKLLADLGLSDPTSATAPDLRPAGGSALLGAGATPSDGFFTATTYIGAFDQSEDWTAGWTTYAAN